MTPSASPTHSDWPSLGSQVGPWVLVRPYQLEGSGEMFVAKRADGAFEREVLITFLRPDATNPFAKEDFEFEVELQAKLDHPGIAKVFGAGSTPSGIPYMVTEYLPGKDIATHLQDERAELGERIRLFLEVCRAVQHAHEQGVVGLHLQASNIHLLPDGTIRTVVYGLAATNRPERRPQDPTWPQFAVDYSSPEEWAGERITGAADLYSLGALLHLLLTGSLPYELQGLPPSEAARLVRQEWKESASERIRRLGSEDLAMSYGKTQRQWAQAVAGDLDRIVDKALAQLPSQRYATPQDLAEDLTRHLAGQPIRARGPAPFYALRRGFSRHRTAILLASGVLGALTWALNRSFQSAWLAESALEDARRAEREADHQSTRLRELCVRFLTELGPSMQGRAGLEEARRYLLNVGAPLLDHLQQSGHDDPKLRAQLARSYSLLAEADWIAQDSGSFFRTPDSVHKAREMTAAVLLSPAGSFAERGVQSWARSVRCALWFSELMLDGNAAEEILKTAADELAAAGISETDLPALARIPYLEAKRLQRSQALRFDEALELWDLRKLQAMAQADPTMEAFILGDMPRFETIRTGLLLRSAHEREALFELPTLVYQLQEEVQTHQPPVSDLLHLETSSWLMLALARTRLGLPPGEALPEALGSLARFQEQFQSSPGVSHNLADLWLWLAECYWNMGPASYQDALAYTDRAAELWRTMLRKGARWPSYQANLAETLDLRTRILWAQGNQSAAQWALVEALRILADLAQPAADHVRTKVLQIRLQLQHWEVFGAAQSVPFATLEAEIEALAARQVDPSQLEPLRTELQRVRRQGTHEGEGKR